MRLRACPVAVTAVLVVGACASGDDSENPFGGGARDIRAYLARLPAVAPSDEPVVVSYADVAGAADIAGVDAPDELGDEDAVVGYLQAITGGPLPDDGGDGPVSRSSVAIAVPEVAQVQRAALEQQEFLDDVGWSFLRVASFAEAGVLPDVVTVLQGDFDDGQLTEALGEPEDGVWMVGDPGGDVVVSESSVGRPIGEPLWFAHDGDRLLVARSEDAFRAARDVAGDGSSLAADEVFASLAEALDRQGAYTAQLVRGSFDDSELLERLTPDQIEELCACSPGPSPVGVATGLAEDDGPVILVVRAHADESAAEEDAAAFEQLVAEGVSFRSGDPWSDQVTLDEIETEGAVVTARLRPVEDSMAPLWRDVMLTRDSLVMGTC